MVEKVHYAAPMRSIWYISEDPQNASSEQLRWRISSKQHVWRPPTDLYETEDTFVVKVEVAGMQESEFNISIEGRLLTIRGVRPDTPERRAYHQMEIPFGEFSTEVDIPHAVVAEQITAVYSDGFLRIVLPKALHYQIHIES